MRLGIIMTRVSTDEQNKGNSPTDQLKACRAYAHQNDIDVPEHMIFHEDYTGYEYLRPELNKIRAILEKNKGMTLIVRSGDRLARSALVALMIAGDLVKYEVDLHFVSRGKVDIRTPEGLFIFQMEAAGNEYWGSKAKEAMRNGRMAQAESGIPAGQGPAPYGYKKVGRRRETQIVVDPEAAKIVILIFEWYALEKMSVMEIARKLNAMGVPTPSQSHKNFNQRVKHVNKWNPRAINNILREEAYAGTMYFYKTYREGTKTIYRPREEWIPVEVEPIISRELFEKARAVAASQAKVVRGAAPKYMYLMSKRIRCDCGRAALGRTSILKHGGRYYYYACGTMADNTKSLFGRTCTLPYFRVEWVDEAVWEWIDELYRDPEKIRERLKAEQQRAKQSVMPFYEEMERLEQQIKTMGRQLEEMIADQYKAEKPRSKAIFAKMIADTEQSIEEAEEYLTRLRVRVDPMSITDEYIESVVERARELSPQGRRAGKIQDDQNIIHEYIVNEQGEPVAGLPRLYKPDNTPNEQAYGVVRKEVERLNLTGTLAMENGEHVLHLHWNTESIRLVVHRNGKTTQDASNSASFVGELQGNLHA